MSDLRAAWPSLNSIAAIATSDADWTDWFTTQLTRVASRKFAHLFTKHIQINGATWPDFAHRVIERDGTRLLGGIRFYGQDVSRPFVELIAWSDPVPDWTRYRHMVAEAWSLFAPHALRVLTTDALPPDARGDLSIHAASCAEMATPTSGKVTLNPIEFPGAAIAMVREVYDHLAVTNPILARDLSPADADTLSELWRNDTLRAICHAQDRVGVIGWRADTIDWLTGQVVVEEVILPEHRGQGHAAAAQKLLAHTILTPQDRLIGTILHTNTASRRTALTAGRPCIARYAFLDLPHR